MSCSKNSGRIKMIRFVTADVRYVGICDDCGIRTEPTSMASAHLALNNHFQFGSAHKCDCADSCLICGRVRSAHGEDQECPIPAFEGWVEQFVPSGCSCGAPRLFDIDTRGEQVFEPAKVVRLDSRRRGCVCAECAPALAAARKADLDAEIEASRRRRS